MEALIFLGVVLGVILLGVLTDAIQKRKSLKQLRAKLRREFGSIPNKRYSAEREQHISGFYRTHAEESTLDEITWNDLDMERIFRRLNDTHSATGEEYLYYLLHCTNRSEDDYTHLEELIQYLTVNEDVRVELQVLFAKLGTTGKYSLYDYLDYLDDLECKKNLPEHLINLTLLLLVGVLFWNVSIGLLLLVCWFIWRCITYFQAKAGIESYLTSFTYIIRLIEAGKLLLKMGPDKKEASPIWVEAEAVRENIRNLDGMKTGYDLLTILRHGGPSSNPLDLLLDYFCIVFHADIIAFYIMLEGIRKQTKAIDQLVIQMGLLESAICIASFRQSVMGEYCIPEFAEEKESIIQIEDGYHPLLMDSVKNSIYAKNGVLLTGSNASGKSTFLKMVAINAVLAQTIHTCTAGQYRGSVFRIYSSMALRDNLESGESYYIVEIKALKRILDASAQGERVLCFVDEVLRGTNTIERIAASTQILRSLQKGNVLCFAATHDIELTTLLQDCYDNYHFEERIEEGNIVFPYRLCEGKALGRNAILLLKHFGYPVEVIAEAEKSVSVFEQTGSWQA